MRFVENLCWPQIRFLQRIRKESKKHHVRQRAHCILLSYQRYQVTDLARIFDTTERTIYKWLDLWETHHFVGLYDRKGRGRKPKLDDGQRRQVKEWANEYPKNPSHFSRLYVSSSVVATSLYLGVALKGQIMLPPFSMQCSPVQRRPYLFHVIAHPS